MPALVGGPQRHPGERPAVEIAGGVHGAGAVVGDMKAQAVVDRDADTPLGERGRRLAEGELRGETESGGQVQVGAAAGAKRRVGGPGAPEQRHAGARLPRNREARTRGPVANR